MSLRTRLLRGVGRPGAQLGSARARLPPRALRPAACAPACPVSASGATEPFRSLSSHTRELHTRELHTHNKPPASPDEALEWLRQGNARFVRGELLSPNRNIERLKATSAGQRPFAAFLSCADSRVPIEILFDQGFGDIFVTRVAGNIVTTELTASLEFGCAVLGAKVLYVLGHSSCGAVAATQAAQAVPGVISSLYYAITPACRHAAKHGTGLSGAVEENVRIQARLLSVSPVLDELVSSRKLSIVGGVFDLESGKVRELISITADGEKKL